MMLLRCYRRATTAVFLLLWCARRVASFSPSAHRNNAAKPLVVLNKIPLDGGSNSEPSDLLERAARLRKEIEELESKQQATTTRPRVETPKVSEAKAVEYSSMDDSVWLLSYRFSDQPEPSDDEEKQAADDDAAKQPRRFYRGKVVLKFLSDGYTEIIEKQSLGSESEKVDIVKAWGWDIEESNEEDGQEYLIFSMDVDLAQLSGGERIRQRFYFQARQDKDTRSQAISLSQGTVTIKKDVVQKSARWGFFSPAGILAQFRYVGDFIAKPTDVST